MLTVLPFMLPQGLKAFKTQRADLHFYRAVIGVGGILVLASFGLYELIFSSLFLLSMVGALFFIIENRLSSREGDEEPFRFLSFRGHFLFWFYAQLPPLAGIPISATEDSHQVS